MREKCKRKTNIMFPAIVTIGLILIMIAVSQLLGTSYKVNASGTAVHSYSSVQIQEGDTLWSLAQAYMDEDNFTVESFISEIKEVNRLGDDIIHAGDYLTIPCILSKDSL